VDDFLGMCFAFALSSSQLCFRDVPISDGVTSNLLEFNCVMKIIALEMYKGSTQQQIKIKPHKTKKIP
jgi:hypothetical protein